jgi:hypothetical protein
MSVTALKNHRRRFRETGVCPSKATQARKPKAETKSPCPHCGRAFGPTVIARHHRRYTETGACPSSRRKTSPDPLSKCDIEYIRKHWT